MAAAPGETTYAPMPKIEVIEAVTAALLQTGVQTKVNALSKLYLQKVQGTVGGNVYNGTIAVSPAQGVVNPQGIVASYFCTVSWTEGVIPV